MKSSWAIWHFKLGNALYQQQDLVKASHNYRQAIDHDPNYVNAFYNLGVVLEQQGRQHEAIEAYTQTIGLQPQHLNAHCNLGCALVKQEKFEAAILVFQQAIEIAPDWAELHSNLGKALLGINQTGAAIVAFNQAIHLQPDLALAHYNLGKAWQLTGYHIQAVDCFERSISLNPKLEIAYSGCAASLLESTQLDRAVRYLQHGMQPAEFVASYCQETDLVIESLDQMERARLACAKFLTLCQNLPTSDPKHDFTLLSQDLSQIYIHYGHVYFEYGDYGQAEVHYRRAFKLKPDAPELLISIGNSLGKQERLNEATISYNLALAFQPDHSEALFQLGKTLEKLGQFAQSIECYQRVWHLGDVDDLGEIDQPREVISGIYLHSQDWQNHAPALPVPDRVVPIRSRDVCAGLNCLPCLSKLSPSFDPIYLGDGIYQCFHTGYSPLNLPPHDLDVLDIPNGKAWIAPTKNYWNVCNAVAILTEDNYLLADRSRDYPSQLPLCQQYNPTQHLLFWQDALPPLEVIAGKVAVLAGLSGNVYFHWMVDVLPRWDILNHNQINLEEIDWFLVNSFTAPFQRQTLEILGIPVEKILESDRHPYIQAQNLIVPSFASDLGWLSNRSIQFLRQTFRPDPNPVKHYPERIYISRAKAKYRKIYNEVAVIDLLSQYGFVAVNLESISFLEQVALFTHAKVIVGAHGSGLTNIMFCQLGATVIEIFSPDYIRQYFWVISQHLHLKHYYLLGEAFACYPLRQLMFFSPLVEDILVNLNQLKSSIELVMGESNLASDQE